MKKGFGMMRNHLGTVFSGLSLVLLSCLIGIGANAQELSPRDDPAVQRVAPFQVFDNLYYVGARWVSAWVLETDQGLILFDALYGELTELIIDGMEELGLDPHDLRYVIVTHAHYDHIGGARRMQQEFGAVMMMTDSDWQMTTEPAIYQEYPAPMRHLTATDGSTLNLGRTRLEFFQTPGHTPGVLSTRFTVYDDGYPHDAFMFGGVGLNFSGVERTNMYIDSVKRIQKMSGIEVNIPNHEGFGAVFARNELLKQRKEGEPHPFVDADGFSSWLDTLLVNAQAKLVEEKAAVN
jgi:metallo-beta-lactamase class B